MDAIAWHAELKVPNITLYFIWKDRAAETTLPSESLADRIEVGSASEPTSFA